MSQFGVSLISAEVLGNGVGLDQLTKNTLLHVKLPLV